MYIKLILKTTEDKNIEKLKSIIRYKAYGLLEQEETEQQLINAVEEKKNLKLNKKI